VWCFFWHTVGVHKRAVDDVGQLFGAGEVEQLGEVVAALDGCSGSDGSEAGGDDDAELHDYDLSNDGSLLV